MTDTDETKVQELWPDGEGPLRKRFCCASEDALIVDVGGFEGPLDLLLELARHHKVDLAQISILALAEQYLAYIDNARKMRIEVAADYLVMAAWLAYLKSRLLLPNLADRRKRPLKTLPRDWLSGFSACRPCAMPQPSSWRVIFSGAMFLAVAIRNLWLLRPSANMPTI